VGHTNIGEVAVAIEELICISHMFVVLRGLSDFPMKYKLQLKELWEYCELFYILFYFSL